MTIRPEQEKRHNITKRYSTTIPTEKESPPLITKYLEAPPELPFQDSQPKQYTERTWNAPRSLDVIPPADKSMWLSTSPSSSLLTVQKYVEENSSPIVSDITSADNTPTGPFSHNDFEFNSQDLAGLVFDDLFPEDSPPHDNIQ